ncbi:MAG: transposase domain-containing protein [Shimia sp.]
MAERGAHILPFAATRQTERPEPGYPDWWSPAALAASGLPDVPTTKRGVNSLAARERWRAQATLARTSPDGGYEYHWHLLPQAAQRVIASARGMEAQSTPGVTAWAAYEGATAKARDRAMTRLRVVEAVTELRAGGVPRTLAVKYAAEEFGAGVRSIHDWLKLVDGTDRRDWLAHLLPGSKGGSTPVEAPLADSFMGHLQSLFLRPEQPTFAQCYRDTVKVAKATGWVVPPEHRARRMFKRAVPKAVEVLKRQGQKALMRLSPGQIRDRQTLHAMQLVNADCHRFDVMVRWPDGRVDRPTIAAFQDVYSGKLLSWRVDHAPNRWMVMSAFGEMVEDYGIPRECLFDNGMEFASKDLTGGMKTRYRFKVREDEPHGVLTILGINVVWAQPAHGQAKPIERAFRDIASDVSKDPRFTGAYVGHAPHAKPENYGERAVPLETFVRVLGEGVLEHNARDGRQGGVCGGRSFDRVFAESYAEAPIMRAQPEQRPLWLMASRTVKVPAEQVQVKLQGNFYYSPWLIERAGQELVARFDPEDLHRGIDMFDKDGRHLGFLECRSKVGFRDMDAARETTRRRARELKLTRELAELHAPIPVAELGAALDRAEPPMAPDLAAKVVALPQLSARAPQMGRRKATPEPAADPAVEARRDAMIHQLEVSQKAQSVTMSAGERFLWAQEVLAKSERGEPVGEDELSRARGYAGSSEYRAQRRMFETFGKEGLT